MAMIHPVYRALSGRPIRGLLPALLLCFLPGCLFSPDKEPIPPPQRDPIPTPTIPENLILALEVIYDDQVRSATERKDAYEGLFASDFKFVFEHNDIEAVGRQDWGLADEVAAHENMFRAQENHQILSLTLDIEFLEPSPASTPGDSTRHEILATDVNLVLLTGPDDGFTVQAGQADFYVSEADGRWWIKEWLDRPSRSGP